MRACVFTVPQLIYGGKLDFLVFDYLSEITMSLLTAARSKSPVSVGEDAGAGDKDDDDDNNDDDDGGGDEDTVPLSRILVLPQTLSKSLLRSSMTFTEKVCLSVTSSLLHQHYLSIV